MSEKAPKRKKPLVAKEKRGKALKPEKYYRRRGRRGAREHIEGESRTPEKTPSSARKERHLRQGRKRGSLNVRGGKETVCIRGGLIAIIGDALIRAKKMDQGREVTRHHQEEHPRARREADSRFRETLSSSRAQKGTSFETKSEKRKRILYSNGEGNGVGETKKRGCQKGKRPMPAKEKKKKGIAQCRRKGGERKFSGRRRKTITRVFGLRIPCHDNPREKSSSTYWPRGQ